jgi:hypothetical protein
MSAISVVLNNRCDMIVATVVLAHDRLATIEPGLMEVSEKQDRAALGREVALAMWAA